MKPVYSIRNEKSGIQRKASLFLRLCEEYPVYDREQGNFSRVRPASRDYSGISPLFYISGKRAGASM